MTIPELAKRLYEKFGSWSKAARALNISDTALYAWRDGRTIPGFNFTGAIAEALSLQRDEIRETLVQAHEARDNRLALRGSQMTLSIPRKGDLAKVPPRQLMRDHALAGAMA
jgi:hypothetical protein